MNQKNIRLIYIYIYLENSKNQTKEVIYDTILLSLNTLSR